MTRLSSLAATLSLLSSLGLASFGAAAVEPTAPGLADIVNFRQYSPTFASYIAFTNNPNALTDADQVIKGLGMEYMHIPVDWNNPLASDFYAFADSLQRDTDKKTLLHCQVNARATAFSFLYRVIYEGADMAEAKADMNTVWQPNETWRDFIIAVLAENGLSAECEGCDWALRDNAF
jgi:hypothetical protein